MNVQDKLHSFIASRHWREGRNKTALMITVYVIYSRSLKKHYVGQTSNFEDRLIRHNSGRNRWTKIGVPWEPIWTFECKTRSEAMKLERKIKKRGAKRFLDDQLGV